MERETGQGQWWAQQVDIGRQLCPQRSAAGLQLPAACGQCLLLGIEEHQAGGDGSSPARSCANSARVAGKAPAGLARRSRARLIM